ncbi:MAG: transketolase C-terminal domain-containing protein [bacterium]|nr:transketolase C-terminal domain-containing protein [bacterium]
MKLKKNQHIHKKVFTEPEMIPIRQGFGDGLKEVGGTDPRVVALCADLTESTKMNMFADAYPERYIQIGIAEQNLASVASGMAAMGKIPFISSYAMFSPGRNWEQIRTTLCYNNQPVNIVGSHAGVSVGPDGGTHQAIEDIAITRVIPRMHVIVPADSIEAHKATVACAGTPNPTYLRLAREKTAVVTTKKSPFTIGKANVLTDFTDPQAVVIACGPMVFNALRAAQILVKEGIEVTVINNHTIKPLDTKTILKEVRGVDAVVTIEEHQRAGGMGSAVCEFLAGVYPVPIEFLGVNDVFGQSGEPEELIEHYGMGISHIVEAVYRVLKRKGSA